MKQVLAFVVAILLAIVVVFGVGWLVMGNQFFMYKFFAPKFEQARRNVFEQTKSFNQGMIQELENMQFEYEKASPEHKPALASIILHRASGFNLEDPNVPSSLRAFVYGLKKEQTKY